MDDNAYLDERALSKLKWRCRRGLLENDLFIERFFARHESGITVRQARALNALMDLSSPTAHREAETAKAHRG